MPAARARKRDDVTPERPATADVDTPEDQGPGQQLPSLRRSLFLRFGALVTFAVALFALGYLVFGLRPVVEDNCANQFAVTAQAISADLDQSLRPVENLVTVAAAWGVAPGFDLERPREFNRLFQPVLVANPQITSVVAGSSDGKGWMLLQQDRGRWLNRFTDVVTRGRRQQHFIEWQADGSSKEHWESLDYDPRQRPWYSGAVESPDGRSVYWTPPYVFFTTHDPGITVSTHRELPDGRDLVVGYDIKLLDLSRTTGALHIGNHGFAAVLTSDLRVLGLPSPLDLKTPDEMRQAVLRPVAGLGVGPLTAALDAWTQAGTPNAGILHFTSDDTPWLATFQPYRLGDQVLWVTAVAPVADFVPTWRPMVQALAAILSLVLLLTLFLARRQARHFSAPLEALALDSEQIARLDFASHPSRPQHYREISRLAAAQEGMRRMLQDFRDTVMAQEEDLRRQIGTLQATEQQLRQSQHQLQTALGRQQAILDNTLVGIIFVQERTIIHANRRFQELFGYSSEELLGQSTEKIHLNRDYFIAVGERIRQLLGQGENFTEELWLRRRDQSRFWGQISGRAIDPADPAAGSVWIVADLTERRAAEERLQHLGHHDSLTELPNRLLFNDRLAHAILLAGREERQLGLLFVDLDHFKNINDSLGHQFGDRLLCEVARRLAGSLRASDTLARLGGDEFILLVEDLRDLDHLILLAGKLLEALGQPLTIDQRQVYITGSIGIAVFPADGADATTLVRNADAAMYQAKALGRNAFHFYSEEMTRRTALRLEMEGRLRQAVATGSLELHLQPRVDLATGRFTGAEALVRMRDPELGLILPGEFIPLAEETSLIFEVGQWVLEEACRHWRTLADQGIRLPHLAVNLSVKQLQRPNLLQCVREALDAVAMPAGILELELTESFFLETEGAFDLLGRLAEIGVSLAVDDFGTGYSSLSYLKRLPFGQLKIDRSFIADIGRDADGEALVRTIINLAGTLGMEVTAEGVETERQRQFLLREGCRQAQGFLFARPLPLDRFLAWCRQDQPPAAPDSAAAP